MENKFIPITEASDSDLKAIVGTNRKFRFFAILWQAAAFGLLVWTVYLGYQSGGIPLALSSALFIGFAQLYWCFKLWYLTGVVFTPYCIAVLCLIGLLILAYLTAPKD